MVLFDNDDPMRPGAPKPPAATGGSDFGTGFKPWETIDSTYSQDQWKAWEPSRDSACPPDRPYKAERTYEDGTPITECLEKPVDCPPGSYAVDSKGRGFCRKGQAPGGGGGGQGGPGGGGGGGGAAGGGGVGSAFFDPASGMSKLTGASIAQILAGGTRFNPSVMADLTAQAKRGEQATIERGTRELREQQAARGIAFSPVGASQESALVSSAAQSFDQQMQQIRVQKAVTDFEDKLNGLKLGLDWMQDIRKFYQGMDSNNVQREGIEANFTLGMARIKADMDMLMQELAGKKDLLGMQLDSDEWQTTQQLILCLNTGVC